MLLGMNAVCYRNTGTYGSPTWDVMTGIGDFQVNCDWDVVKQAVRGNRVSLGAKTFLNLEVTFKMEANHTAQDYIAVRDAVFSDTPLDILVLNDDKDTVGAVGFRFDALFTSHNEDQGAGSALMPEIKMIPTTATTDTANAVPKLAEVGSGPALSYTAIT